MKNKKIFSFMENRLVFATPNATKAAPAESAKEKNERLKREVKTHEFILALNDLLPFEGGAKPVDLLKDNPNKDELVKYVADKKPEELKIMMNFIKVERTDKTFVLTFKPEDRSEKMVIEE